MAPREDIYRVVGRRLRAVREAMGLTQEQVAEKVGMTLSAYSRYESAERRIPLFELGRLGVILRHPTCYFLGEDLSPEQLADWQLRTLPGEDQRLVRELIALLVDRRSAA